MGGGSRDQTLLSQMWKQPEELLASLFGDSSRTVVEPPNLRCFTTAPAASWCRLMMKELSEEGLQRTRVMLMGVLPQPRDQREVGHKEAVAWLGLETA